MPTRPLLLLLLGLVLAGCVIGDEPEEPATATPTFEPEPAEPAADVPDDDIDEANVDVADEASATTEPDGGDAAADSGASPGSDGSSTDAAEESGPSASASEDEGSTGQAEAPEPEPETDPEPTVLRSHATDPRGDTEGLRLTSAPDHADLVGALLTRDGDGYRLTIDLDGGAPEHARDGDHTMNVASFYDLTGDGHVDVEVWANLADGGWDSAQYDNRSGTAAFSDDDEVTVAVEAGRLVLDFPLGVLDGAERFRWAIGSEWGRYEELGTPTSVRDEMPDDGAPAPFPG